MDPSGPLRRSGRPHFPRSRPGSSAAGSLKGELALPPRTRRVQHRRGPHRAMRALLLVAVVLPLASLSLGSTASAQVAPASKESLNQQLDRLNHQADQLVENYLQAKSLLDSTRTDMKKLQGRANQAARDYNQLQAAVSAQWTAAYVRGTGTDIASLLGTSDPTVALQRMQSLELLAQRDAQTVTDLQA